MKECLLIPTRLRLGLTLSIVLMVISSPVVMLVNPASAAPSSSTDASPSAPSTISQDGSDFTTQAALSSLSARPTNNIVNTNSFYDVVFLAATSGTIKTIEVTFPAGTTIPSGAFFNEAEGIGPGTASKSGQTIIYTVTNAVNVPAGTKIRLEFANINNPLNPSSAYQVTVTTRDAANTPIDGPTPSTAYTMKQIGVNAIADNAVTTGKIADGAITTPNIADGAVTTPKIASTFAYQRTVVDGSSGWTPDGALTVFTVGDPSIPGPTSRVLINLETLASGGPVCSVTFIQLGIMEVSCSSAPSDGTQLKYIVFNAPVL